MAFVVGGVFATGLMVRIAERVGLVTDPTVAFWYGWALERVWLFVVLPAIGWVVGRFLSRVNAFDFAVVASIAGEAFGMLLSGGRNGTDFLFVSLGDTAVRVVSFGFGLWLTKLATDAGQRAAKAAASSAATLAVDRSAEYAAFVEQAAADSKPKDPS